jgi:hypothetical protein
LRVLVDEVLTQLTSLNFQQSFSMFGVCSFAFCAENLNEEALPWLLLDIWSNHS